MTELSGHHLGDDQRRRANVDGERGDPVRELIRYLLNRPWVDPNALMGGLIHHEPDHIARLRTLLEDDRATVARCLKTLDSLAAPKD